MYGAFGKRLKKTDSVDEVFKNSRATVSLGYIGLYEVCTTFMGQIGSIIKKRMTLQLQLLKAMHDLCAEWEKEEGYHF